MSDIYNNIIEHQLAFNRKHVENAGTVYLGDKEYFHLLSQVNTGEFIDSLRELNSDRFNGMDVVKVLKENYLKVA